LQMKFLSFLLISDFNEEMDNSHIDGRTYNGLQETF